jgi:DNA polymerase III epsilon subunit-like protein
MKVLYCDLETTGTVRWEAPADHPHQPWPVSLTGLLMDEQAGQELAEPFYRIIKPDTWRIEAGASRIHGITHEQALREGVVLAQAMSEFAALHSQCDVIAAWAARFDMKVLRGAYRRCGMPDRWGANEVLDVAERAQQKAGRKIKLADAIGEILGEHLNKHRDPLEDIRQLRRLSLASA